MKNLSINYNALINFKEAISFMEENALQLERSNQMLEYLIKIRDLFDSSDSKYKVQWEYEYAYLEFRSEKLFSFSHSYQKERDILKFPDLESMNKEAFKYLKERAASTSNPLLKAKYNHLLWKGPKGIKNREYGELALAAYIEVIKIYLGEFKEAGDENLYQIDVHFEILCSLCLEVNSHQKEIKQFSQMLLAKLGLPFWFKASILEEMAKHPRLFKKGDFDGHLQLYREEFNKTEKRTDYISLASRHLLNAIDIAQKLATPPNEWYTMIGQCFLKLAEEETDESRYWIKQDYHAKALQAFLWAGNTEMKAKAAKLYSELKPKVNLPTHEYQFKLTDEQVKALKEEEAAEKRWVKGLLDEGSFDKVYAFLTSGVFFPSISEIKVTAAKTRMPWADMATVVAFDENKNIRHAEQDQLNFERQLYGQHLFNYTLRLSQRILHGGIKKGVLTYENFVHYLHKNTWLGRTFLETDLGGNPVEQNWIGQIAPSIVEYFVQTESSLQSKYYVPNFVLCIDSLVLKFEGLLRNFAAQLSVPTATTSSKGMREIYIHEILEHEIIKRHFNEDDLYFFKYLFTDHGLNLRNKVAHCFQRDDDYPESKMILLILALLRVGKYSFTKKEK